MNPTLDPLIPSEVRTEPTAVQPGLVRVAIVDADDGLRANFAALIDADSACRVVRSCPDAETALNDLPRFKPDVIFLEINLPGMDGVECVRRLKEHLPAAHVIVFSVCEDQARMLSALIAGASGYLLKRTPPPQLVAAIREVCDGGAPCRRRLPGAYCSNCVRIPAPLRRRSN